jgi:CDP-diacylglycerol--glycerol-3-phosphate 3-phosphatidyltransferase
MAELSGSAGVIWTWSNMLTFARVLAAPCVALVFVLLERPFADWVAFVLFTAAALTDYVDGWLARRWNEISEIGKMLDPIADKAMVTIALAVLTGLIGLSFWYVVPVAAILLREVLVSGLREYLGDVKLPVTPLAKWKTTAQMFAIGWLLFFLPDEDGPDAGTLVGFGLLWVAALLTVVTGWDYFQKGTAILRARERR